MFIMKTKHMIWKSHLLTRHVLLLTTSFVLMFPSAYLIAEMTVSTLESTKDDFNVFPNPFTDFIEIHPSAGYSAIIVRLLDIHGRVVHAPVITCPCRLRLDHLPAGVYFYQIEEEGILVKSGKVMKM